LLFHAQNKRKKKKEEEKTAAERRVYLGEGVDGASEIRPAVFQVGSNFMVGAIDANGQREVT
jgi:hypothetical protein